MNETVALLAARAPKLRKAVRDAKKAGCASRHFAASMAASGLK